MRTLIFALRKFQRLNRLECIGERGLDRAMHVAMQTMQKTRSTLHGTKSDPVTPDALNLLEQFGTTVTVLRSHEIYGQGEPTESCWRIISGCVRTAKLSEGRRQIGEFLWVGDLLGMDDLDLHAFNAEAVTDVMLRRYPRRMVEALAQSHTGLALRLRLLAVANLQRTYQQMALLGRKTATEKIASFLLDMHRRSTATDRSIVDLPMSRTDIADYLGLTIETVSRAFARFQRDGIIAVLRSGFELLDRVALLKLTHGCTTQPIKLSRGLSVRKRE
jgi:CRP/FNR family transcriptional regulator, nitrogen fixation regulation protein